MLFSFYGGFRVISEERKTELINQIIKHLPQIRREMKISQTDFGKKVGLSRQTISAIERGVAPLSWKNYLAIMMLIEANRDRFKTIFNDDSQELEEVLAVIHEKN